MAEGKRYFWLKLRDDLFSSRRIKKLRRMAGGDTMFIIYLRLQLLAIHSDGVITFTGLESDFASEMALELDEDVDAVRMTLAYLSSCGLIDTSDEVNYYLPYAVENTGSEADSTPRARELRERRKAEFIEPLTNAERQRNYRAKQSCKEQQHVPFIEDHANRTRYGGNYYTVMKRDGFKCSICGSIERLCVHHIDGYLEDVPENNAEDKMLVLCRGCHSRIHAGAKIPSEILERIGYSNDSNGSNVISNVTCNVREESKEKEIDIEKEKEIDRERENTAAPRQNPASDDECSCVVSLFNEMCPSLPRVSTITNKRKMAICSAQGVVMAFVGGWEALFREVEQSDFLTGRSGKWNGCSFDWIVKEENIVKIMEGVYRNKDAPAGQSSASYDLAEFERHAREDSITYEQQRKDDGDGTSKN